MASSLWDGVWAIVLDCWRDNHVKRPSADEIVSRLSVISQQQYEPAEGNQLLTKLKNMRSRSLSLSPLENVNSRPWDKFRVPDQL